MTNSPQFWFLIKVHPGDRSLAFTVRKLPQTTFSTSKSRTSERRENIGLTQLLGQDKDIVDFEIIERIQTFRNERLLRISRDRTLDGIGSKRTGMSFICRRGRFVGNKWMNVRLALSGSRLKCIWILMECFGVFDFLFYWTVRPLPPLPPNFSFRFLFLWFYRLWWWFYWLLNCVSGGGLFHQ